MRQHMPTLIHASVSSSVQVHQPGRRPSFGPTRILGATGSPCPASSRGPGHRERGSPEALPPPERSRATGCVYRRPPGSAGGTGGVFPGGPRDGAGAVLTVQGGSEGRARGHPSPSRPRELAWPASVHTPGGPRVRLGRRGGGPLPSRTAAPPDRGTRPASQFIRATARATCALPATPSHRPRTGRIGLRCLPRVRGPPCPRFRSAARLLQCSAGRRRLCLRLHATRGASRASSGGVSRESGYDLRFLREIE